MGLNLRWLFLAFAACLGASGLAWLLAEPGPADARGSLETPPMAIAAPLAARPSPATVEVAAREDVGGLAQDDRERTRVLGSIVVNDAYGVSHPVEDGRLFLRLVSADAEELQEVRVLGGLWAAELPLDASYRVQSIELGGRRAALEDAVDAAWTANADSHPSLTARWE